ncbi:MAG: ABC transporter permease [Alphaproteobacteria bacterium]|uniref:Transport permease protein n=1 Tax=Candidatus Nitrobium versatile TaxID=2884831 RepID=A0A953J686_9BACT|nr:ABC transporter permease [Candidatus Nitrobium versatile]
MRNYENYRDLIIVLTQKEMKVRYKNSVFGYFWSVGHPLALAFVYFVAFKVIMKIQMEDYSLFLIAGLFPWQWFATSVNASPVVFVGNASIIKKVNFPRSVIPLTTVLQDMIHFLLSIPVIVLFLFMYHKSPSLSWLYGIPLLLALQLLLTYGVSLAVSSVSLFFRDFERLINIFITFLFYFTPIFYPETMVPEEYRHLLYANPLTPLMISWRELFLTGHLEAASLLATLFYGVIAFVGGYLVYKKLSWKFAEVL